MDTSEAQTEQPVPQPAIERKRLFFLGLAVAVFAFSTAALNNWKFQTLRSTWPYDAAFYEHLAYNYTQGRRTVFMLVPSWFDPGDHHGPSVYRSNHFQPILFFVFQLYRLCRSPFVLFLIQSLMVGSGAIPLYLLVSRRANSPRLGLVVALSYLLHPSILHIGFNDFRSIQLGLGPALWALYFHSRRRMVPFLAAAFTMLCCRQEYVFLLACFGLVNWRLLRREKQALKWLAVPVVIALAWALLVNGYYEYAYGRAWPIMARRRGGDPTHGVFSKFTVRFPIFLSMAWLPGVLGLLWPESYLLALPSIVYSDQALWPAFPQHYLRQYSLAFVLVFWAFANGLAQVWPAISKKPQWERGALAGIGLAAVLAFGLFSAGVQKAYFQAPAPDYGKLKTIRDDLPKDATIMAAKGVLPLLTHFPRVFTYEGLPYGSSRAPSRAQEKKMIKGLLAVCDLVVTEPRPGREWIDEAARASGRFGPPVVMDGLQTHLLRKTASGRLMPFPQKVNYVIYRASRDAPRPADPDARLQEILHWDQMNEYKRRWLLAGSPGVSTHSRTSTSGRSGP